MADNGLYVGHDLKSRENVYIDPDHLTTHAACLGMTGSGKTGLGVVVLEELARRGIPLLVVDLKSDMINLLLNFPSLEGAEFAPWLPADIVADRPRDTVADEVAELWRGGLERHGLGPADLRAVRDGVRWQLLTPGAASLAPLDILPTLSAPPGWSPERDIDATTQRVGGVTSALLSLVGRGGDPLTDRDHVLVSSIVLEHWRRGDALDLPGLVASIADPPMESLGALPLATFYDRSDRMDLVMELNTLLASPAFGAWTAGTPLDMDSLLGTPDAPRASIVSLSHLDQRQRLFVLALLATELVDWMRHQPASSGLRALLYVDEVQGILPPHPANPPTKAPLLTLIKQGRAFGVGAWLATQNPVDLDYKALGNAGVKVIGRLITDRDRQRALEGLGVATMDDGDDPDDVVASLGKREFLLYDVRASRRVRTFSSRWAMSYLRGPVTMAELNPLIDAGSDRRAPPAARTMGDGRPTPPVLSVPVEQRFAAGVTGPAAPELMVRGRVVVERKTLGLDRSEEEIWRIPIDDDGCIDWEASQRVGEEPETSDQIPSGMLFPPSAPPSLGRECSNAEPGYVKWRARQPVVVLTNKRLKLTSERGESQEQFLERCLVAADRADDAVQDLARRRYTKRMETLRRRLERERDELARDQQQLKSRKAEEVLGVVEGLFSVLLGSRSARSAGGKAASRMKTAAGKRRMSQRAASSVVESEREIERIELELVDLADEMQDEVDRIAIDSQEKAAQIEEVAVRPKRADVEVLDLALVWR